MILESFDLPAAVGPTADRCLFLTGPPALTLVASFFLTPTAVGRGRPADTFRALLTSPVSRPTLWLGRVGAVITLSSGLGWSAFLFRLAPACFTGSSTVGGDSVTLGGPEGGLLLAFLPVVSFAGVILSAGLGAGAPPHSRSGGFFR